MKKIVASLLVIALAMLLFSILNNEKLSTDSGEGEVVTSSLNAETPSEIIVTNEIGKHFDIPIASLPQFATYLETEADVEAELARIQFEFLSGDSDHFVLKYGCGNKRCNLLLVQITESDEVKTTDLGEGIFAGFEVFQQKAMLRIAENDGNEVVRHKIVLVDLHSMKFIHPQNQQLVERYFAEALYPITKFEWISETAIRLEIAELADTSYEAIAGWYQAVDSPVSTVEIEL